MAICRSQITIMKRSQITQFQLQCRKLWAMLLKAHIAELSIKFSLDLLVYIQRILFQKSGIIIIDVKDLNGRMQVFLNRDRALSNFLPSLRL